MELQRPLLAARPRAKPRRSTRLAERLGVACVATGNVHCHHRSRRALQDAFVAVRLRSPLDQTEPDRRGNCELGDGLARRDGGRFRDHPEAVAETARVAERLEFDLTRDLGYRYPGAEDPTPTASSPSCAARGWSDRYPGRSERARGRAAAGRGAAR